VELSAGSFQEIVVQHQAMVFSLARRVVTDPGLAEEVAQDVFMELHRKSAEITDGDHLKYWLRRVTVHRAIDQVRKRSARPELQGDEFVEEAHTDGATVESWQQLGLANRVESLVESLPDTQRAVVTLRFQEDMDPDEIATLMNMPVATVKSHLQRAMQLLRRKAAVVLKEYIRE
jgi:RNA polymerase sigma-70 factor (ECF subfamily)